MWVLLEKIFSKVDGQDTHDKLLIKKFDDQFSAESINNLFETASEGFLNRTQIQMLEQIESFLDNPNHSFYHNRIQARSDNFRKSLSEFISFSTETFFPAESNLLLLKFSGNNREELWDKTKALQKSYFDLIVTSKKETLRLKPWIFVILAVIISSTLVFYLTKSLFNANIDTDNLTEQSEATSSVDFKDYDDVNRILNDFIPLDHIRQPHPMTIEMYQKFPEWAGYYASASTIHDIQNIDIDNDNEAEQVIYYSCVGCNAPARNIDIIKNNKIIFTVEGGNLQLLNSDDIDGFQVSTLLLPRGSGKKLIYFEKNESDEYVAVREQIKNAD